MTIQLPEDLETSLKAEVRSGHFASEVEAVAAIIREYFERKPRPLQDSVEIEPEVTFEPVRDHEISLDEILANSKKKRQEQAVNGLQENGSVTIPTQEHDRKPIWERVEELRKSIPDEEWDKLPADGAEQLDHYIYGSPKRPTS